MSQSKIPDVDFIEFVGGPYDGFVLVPSSGYVFSKYLAGRQDPRSWFESWSIKGQPTEAVFYETDLIWVDGPHGEGYYTQRDDRRWGVVNAGEFFS